MRYTAIVYRIAKRERIKPRQALLLYRQAKFYGIGNLARGLKRRVAKAQREREVLEHRQWFARPTWMAYFM